MMTGIQPYLTKNNALLLYASLSAMANLAKVFLPKDHPTILGNICNKILALSPDLHSLFGE